MNTIYMTPDLDETEQYREDEDRNMQETFEQMEDARLESASETLEEMNAGTRESLINSDPNL